MLQSPPASIETKASWTVASAALFVLAMSFGAAWITAVALKDIASEVGGSRSVPALASSLAWLGSGIGGIIMSQIAGRIGTRWTVIFGSLMIGLGLAISTLGPPWPLWIGHGLFIGVIGIGGINAPMYVYVSRWFDRRRGSALALISSGTYLAGTIWPPIFERAIVDLRLAEFDAALRCRRDPCRGPDCGDLFPCAARSQSSGDVIRSRRCKSASARLAAQRRVCDDLLRGGAVLHSDGDAARTSRRVLQRSRHQPVGRRADVIGAARHRLSEPAGLGRNLRSYRRYQYRADWIGLAGYSDDGAPADAE